MGIAERVEAERRAHTGGRCRFGRLEDEVSADDWALLVQLIAEVRERQNKNDSRHGLSAAAISRALRAEGHNVSKDTVQAHAYNRCRCGF